MDYNYLLQEPSIAESPNKRYYTSKVGNVLFANVEEGEAPWFHEFIFLKEPFYASEIQTQSNLLEDTWAHNKMLKLKNLARRNRFVIPSEDVINISIQALNCIKDNDATLHFCNPTADGGALIEFTKNYICFVLEIDNDAEIALLKKTPIPQVEDLHRDSFINTLQYSIANA